MDTNIIVTIIEGCGLATFFYYIINGLKRHIRALKETIEAQKGTLETMEKRIVETEKIGDLYKKMIETLPNDLDNFKTITSKLKDDTIAVLQKAVADKDEQLKSSQEEKLESIVSQETLLNKLLKSFEDAKSEIQKSIIPEDGQEYREIPPDFLVGFWSHSYKSQKSGGIIKELARIKNNGEYYANHDNEPRFRLSRFNCEWDKKIISFDKVDLKTGEVHCRERLRIDENGNYLVGKAKNREDDNRDYRRLS